MVDITTIQGIESIFGSGPKDPYGTTSLAHLTDMALYANHVRYPVPYAGRRPQNADDVVRPPLIRAFDEAMPGMLVFVPYSTNSVKPVTEAVAKGALSALARFVRVNPERSSALIALHGQASVRSEHSVRVAHEFVYSVEAVVHDEHLTQMATQLACKPELLLYTLDMVLRYPFYGTLAGADEWYLSHHVRTAVRMPQVRSRARRPPNLAVPFGDQLASFASRERLPEYIGHVIRLRELLDENGIRQAPAGDIERNVIRYIAQQASLPGKLKSHRKAAGVTAGALSLAALVPPLAVLAGIAAATVSIGGALWDGQMSSSLTGRKWLRFAIEYDVESRIA